MFESFVSDLLNRVLGTYLEDIDSSKLKIGIWGGDVKLRNIIIKQTALDDLNLPVRPIYGKLDELTLKIPWSKLYTEKWEATVSGLKLVAVPFTSVVYDEEKENRLNQELKLNMLKRIEEAKKKAEFEQDSENDSFMEKLVHQVIRNIQIFINDIHIRYEDALACPSMPFAIGVVLKNLTLQSTDSQSNVGLDTAKLIYKLLKVEGFSVYLMPNIKMSEISNFKNINELYHDCESSLVLGPIHLTAKLQLNTRPELDEEKFSIASKLLIITMDSLSVALSRHQYSSLISLMDSLDRAMLSSQYRKYRPLVKSVSGNASLWWKYAYNCILEKIQRVKENWSWKHIQKHRDLCEYYKTLYKKKIINSKIDKNTSNQLDELEKQLDVFNITLCRKQAEVEAVSDIKETKKVQRGWLSSWFYGNNSNQEEDDVNISEKLEAVMSQDDKRKLYEAIGYSEDGGIPPEFPRDYVDKKVDFSLKELTITVVDELLDNTVVCRASLSRVTCSLETRCASSGLCIKSSIQSFSILGTRKNNSEPIIVESLLPSDDVPLVSVFVDKNPLDEKCDVQIKVDAMPLQISYEPLTIANIKDLFSPPQDISLQQLQAAAVKQMEIVKEKSVAGLQAAIDSRFILDLDLNFKASRVILSDEIHKGTIVVTLGSMAVTSCHSDEVNLVSLAASGKEQEYILGLMRSSSYEQFSVTIQDVQVVIAEKEENWVEALSQTSTPLHLLQPMTLKIDLYRCLITSDPNLPKLKINATLPDFNVTITDSRLIKAAFILDKCFNAEVMSPTRRAQSKFSEPVQIVDVDTEDISMAYLQNISQRSFSEETIQFTEFMFSFVINNINLDLLKVGNDGTSISLININSQNNSIHLTQKTFEFLVELSIGEICMMHKEWQDHCVITTKSTEANENLVSIKFCKINPKSPEIITKYNSVSEIIDIRIARISINLEQGVLISIFSFVNNINEQLSTVVSTQSQSESESPKIKEISKQKQCKRTISACIDQIDLYITQGTYDLILLNVKGLSLHMLDVTNLLSIFSTLEEFSVTDPKETSLHHDIFILEDKTAWTLSVKIFSNEPEYFDTNKHDIELDLEIGRPKIIFLNKVVTEVLNWVDAFQYAKEAIISASQAAVEVCKSNLQEAYAKHTKVSLHFVLKAPVVIVPYNSNSNGGLLADFGKMIIDNEFRLGKQKNNFGHSCLLDDITVQIQNVKFSRKRNFESTDENCILYPISLTLSVTRNLSISWYTAPEIDVTATMQAIQFDISEDDIQDFYAVLKGNLAETSGVPVSDDEYKYDIVPNMMASQAVASPKQTDVYIKMSLTFNMESVTLNLSTSEKEEESNLRKNKSFAKFELQRLSSKVLMMSDGDITTNLALYDCLIEDTRKDLPIVITKMLSKKSVNSPLLDLSYSQSVQEMFKTPQDNRSKAKNFFKKQKETIILIEVNIAQVVLILHLPFLLQLQYIVQHQQKVENKLEQKLSAQKSIMKGTSKIEELSQLESNMKIKLKIEKPDIVLVENLMDINTSSIFLHAEIESEMNISSSHNNIPFSISQLELYAACFNEQKRRETTSCILQKSSMIMIYSSTDSHAGNIFVTMSPMDLTVTPETVALMMNIVSCLSTDENYMKSKDSIKEKDWNEFWYQKPIDYEHLPILNVESAVEAYDELAGLEVAFYTYQQPGTLCVEFECIMFTLESGVETNSIPLLKAQSCPTFTVKGIYTDKLSMSGTLSLEIAYFNPKQAIWEPLLEPVERFSPSGNSEYSSWTMGVEADYCVIEEPRRRSPSLQSSMTDVTDASLLSDDTEYIEIEVPQPILKISLESVTSMEFTVTKTSLEVLNTLSEAFMKAYTGQLSISSEKKSPYKVVNKTGIMLILDLNNSDMQISTSGSFTDQIELGIDCEASLYNLSAKKSMHRRSSSLVTECQVSLNKYLVIKIPNEKGSLQIPVTKTEKRYYSFSYKKKKFGIVSSISVENGRKIITLGSCIQIKNGLNVGAEIYTMTAQGNSLVSAGIVNSFETKYLPVRAFTNTSAEIFFSISGYAVCIQPLIWKSLQNYPDLIQNLSCKELSKEKSSFDFVGVCSVENIYMSNSHRKTVDSILVSITLKPPMQLFNMLTTPITVRKYYEDLFVEDGDSIHITEFSKSTHILSIKIPAYDGANWQCYKVVESEQPEFSVWSFTKEGNKEQTLELAMHSVYRNGVRILRLYCPFWMVNKTGYDLIYREDSTHFKFHLSTFNSPVLFAFQSKAILGKKKARLQIGKSEQSEKFPLDTVGSSGSISCQWGDTSFKISIDIELAASGLTKIVSFSPFYKILNCFNYDIEYKYPYDGGKWHMVSSGNCASMWPHFPSNGVIVRVSNTKEETPIIHYHTEHTTLFKLNNQYGGVLAEAKISEGSSVLTIDKCLSESCAALVINHLEFPIDFWQDGHKEIKVTLQAKYMTYYSWESAEKPKKIYVSSQNTPQPVLCSLTMSGRGKLTDEIGWSSFMVGAQTCLLVSSDPVILEGRVQSCQLERAAMEVEISFNKIGLSFVNDITRSEILYASMSSSGIVWEHKKLKGRKFRPFTDMQNSLLEKSYQMYSREVRLMGEQRVESHYILSSNLELDFSTMMILKPFRRIIRRTFYPGIWAKYQSFPKEQNLHLKVNNFKIDNQMPDSIFPVVLARVPPPKSIMTETVPKPFLEFSVIESKESEVFKIYKYLTLLIQEFHLQVELPFIFAIIDAITQSTPAETQYTKDVHRNDLNKVKQTLTENVCGGRTSMLNFYHCLHLSPIKMHLGFSLTGLDSASGIPLGGEFIQLFLQSVGVTLTEVRDVVLKLGYFEKYNYWMDFGTFQSEVISHYTNQVLKQVYVLVFGLDVLGNPYGLFLGVTKGFGDLFYEPIQGAVEGPGEFAEGLVYGMQSFMGKTVGGAAGAFSKITRTIGKGVATLTFDEDYMRERREAMNKAPSDGLESFARGGKGIVSGVADGVTGVFMKPIEGAKEQGVEGFVKGVFKGGIGLVTRPVSGVIDFASGSFDAVLRATDNVEDIVQTRPTRYIDQDGIIRPYSMRTAEGAKLLRDLEKGQYIETDYYVVHASTYGSRQIFLASNNRIFLIAKNDILGYWKVEWAHSYSELSESPNLTTNGIRLPVKLAKKKVLGVFGGGDNSKIVKLQQESEYKFVVDKISEAYRKICSL